MNCNGSDNCLCIKCRPPLKRRMSLDTPKAALRDDHRRRKQRKIERLERQRSTTILDTPISTPTRSPAVFDFSPNVPTKSSPYTLSELQQKNIEEESPIQISRQSSANISSPSSSQYSSVKAQKNSKNLQGKYEIVAYLGHGSYGHVYKAINLTTKEEVAIKRVVGVFENVTTTKRLLRELRMLRSLDHDNIIEFHEIIAPIDINNFQDLWLVFEFVETDLHKLINHPQQFTELHVQFFLYQILLGVHFMHTAQIMHRDIKPANLLVNSNCTLKICDFGLARGIHIGHGGNDTPFYNETNDNDDDDDDDDTSSSDDNNDDDKKNDDPFRPEIMRQIHPDLIRSANEYLKQKSIIESSTSSNSPLNKSKTKLPPPPPPLKRRLTQHVVTRWYRAPELILCTNTYTAAIDMWSIGCVFAELLTMLKPKLDDRRPVFPGTSCYPLSNDKPMPFQAHSDQLNVIFEVIGTPTEEEISIYPEKTRKFLQSLPTHTRSLHERFNHSDLNALDLLENLLQFDPKKRYDVKRCLKHPYLEDVVDNEMEKRMTSKPIDFEFEDVCFNDAKAEIRKLVIQEILYYNPHLAPLTKPRVELLPESPRISTPSTANTILSPSSYLAD